MQLHPVGLGQQLLNGLFHLDLTRSHFPVAFYHYERLNLNCVLHHRPRHRCVINTCNSGGKKKTQQGNEEKQGLRYEIIGPSGASDDILNHWYRCPPSEQSSRGMETHNRGPPPAANLAFFWCIPWFVWLLGSFGCVNLGCKLWRHFFFYSCFVSQKCCKFSHQLIL